MSGNVACTPTFSLYYVAWTPHLSETSVKNNILYLKCHYYRYYVKYLFYFFSPRYFTLPQERFPRWSCRRSMACSLNKNKKKKKTRSTLKKSSSLSQSFFHNLSSSRSQNHPRTSKQPTLNPWTGGLTSLLAIFPSPPTSTLCLPPPTPANYGNPATLIPWPVSWVALSTTSTEWNVWSVGHNLPYPLTPQRRMDWLEGLAAPPQSAIFVWKAIFEE